MSRRRLRYALVCLSCLTLAGCGPGDRPQSSDSRDHALALVGAKIYPAPDAQPIDDGFVLVRDGRIAEIGRRESVKLAPGAEVLDYRGLVIVPGFWNSHVHFTEAHWNGADTASATSLSRHLQEMLTRYGFVHALDTGSWLGNTDALRDRIDRGELPGPAIQTTGPGFVPEGGSPFYILPAKLPELRSATDAKSQVAARLTAGADAIKLFTGSVASPTNVVPMSLEVVRAATAEAHRGGKLVLAHPTNNEGAQVALEGGVDILAHTTPDGGPWKPDFAERMKQAGMGLIPTLHLWRFELSRKGADSVTIERFMGVAIEQLRTFVEIGGEVLFGTDVGYMTDYDPSDEYRSMARAGMSFRQILTALTTAPARRFGARGKTSGTLAPGMDADLVVLEGDPERDVSALGRVRATIRKGKLIFSEDTR
jgi:imidazolonepropionase-like amidohydrolase